MLLLLRQRNFALLWIGGLISLIGDRALLTALPFYVYQQTGSTLASSAMFLALYLPTFLLSSVTGVFADRWNRKRLMVVTNVLQAVVILWLLIPHSDEWLWSVYVVFFLETSLAMFFEPAESALLPHLVSEEDLVAANGLNALNNNLARLVGPPLGGLLLALDGITSVAIVDSATFVISGILIACISIDCASATNKLRITQGGVSALINVWGEWREGVRLIRRDPVITRLLIIVGITSFGGSMFDPLVAPWVQSALQGGADILGWLSTTGAIGGILGGIILSRLSKGIKPSRLFAVGNMTAGILLLILYNLTLLRPVLVLSCLKSIPLVATGAGLQTLLQISVPDTHRGRIYGAFSTTNGVVGLAALGVAGLLGEVVGIVPILSLAAGITIFSGLLALGLLPDTRVSHRETESTTSMASGNAE